MNKLVPEKVRYIKLGVGGNWEKWCLDNDAIRLGYESPYHNESVNGEWEIVRSYWLDARNGNEAATSVTWLAKIKTTMQLVTCCWILASLYFNNALMIFLGNFLLFLALIITMQTGLSYTIATFRR